MMRTVYYTDGVLRKVIFLGGFNNTAQTAVARLGFLCYYQDRSCDAAMVRVDIYIRFCSYIRFCYRRLSFNKC